MWLFGVADFTGFKEHLEQLLLALSVALIGFVCELESFPPFGFAFFFFGSMVTKTAPTVAPGHFSRRETH